MEARIVQSDLSQEQMVMNQDAYSLWNQIVVLLDSWRSDWRSEIELLNQQPKARKRRRGEVFEDNEIFEGMLKAVLSNSTDWRRVESVMDRLPELFCNFSLSQYALKNERYVADTLVPTFKSFKAGSMTLGRDLNLLIESAKKLAYWSEQHGSADSFFDGVIARSGGDIIEAVVLLGTQGSVFKLPGMGIPLAAEAMKNIGYEVAKPDRHICRALGCWGLVKFRRPLSLLGTKAPEANSAELISTMRAMERFATLISVSPSYLDQVIWLLCSRKGPHLSNEMLAAMTTVV